MVPFSELGFYEYRKNREDALGREYGAKTISARHCLLLFDTNKTEEKEIVLR